MLPVPALSKLQETRHVGAVRPVERLAGGTGHLRRLPLEGLGLAGDLEQELLLVPFEIDPVGDGHHHHRAPDELRLRAEFGDGERLGDVAERVFPRPGERRHGSERQHDTERDDPAHRHLSSFDFDGHHDADARSGQAVRPLRPYDWSLDRPGAALHVGASSPVIPPDLDPHLAPAHQPVLIVLGGGAEPVGAYVRSLMIAWCATVFLAAMGALAFTAAVTRLPAVQQASIDAEGV